ncbi:MAG: Replication protein [Verrucomicrobiota bacterium]
MRSSGPAGAAGEWSGTWASVRIPREARAWVAGWDRADRCPADPRDQAAPGAARTWRELGPWQGKAHRDAHELRRRVVRLLRRAGYVARHRWARMEAGTRTHGRSRVVSWAYLNGPAVGCEAVDPWILAARLRSCSAYWHAAARVTDEHALRVVAQPQPCGRSHVCPACAGWESWTLARALRDVVGDQLRTGTATSDDTAALLTWTHRDVTGRTLVQELRRLREAMRRLTTGRPGREWRARIPDWFYGIEVTRGGAGRAGQFGQWWHVHAHVVIRAPGGGAELARWVGERWRDATRAAAVATGLTAEDGWQPHAGGVWDETSSGAGWVPSMRPGWRESDGYGWWRPIRLDEPKEVYQACKYPTPAAELHPVALAEFVSVAHNRRWHDGGGAWRGVRRRAAELDPMTAADGEDAPSYDVGQNVVILAPRLAPALDTVAPALGYERCPSCGTDDVAAGHRDGCRMRRADASELVTWTLTRAADPVAVSAAAARVGGQVYLQAGSLTDDSRPRTWGLTVPRGAAADLLREWAAATRRQDPEP